MDDPSVADQQSRSVLLSELPAGSSPDLGFSNEKLRRIIDELPTLIAFWDTDLKARFANRAYNRWFGVDHLNLSGTNIREVVGAELFAANEPMMRGALRGERQQFERLMHCVDGVSRNTLVTYIPTATDGVATGFIVHIIEINRLKEAEDALRCEILEHKRDIVDLHETAERLRIAQQAFRQTLTLNGQIPWTADADGGFAVVSPDWTKQWNLWIGDDGAGAIEAKIASLIHDDDRDRARLNRVQAFAAREAIDHRYRILSRAGGYRWIRFRAAPVIDDFGEVSRWLGTIEDIDDMVRVEERAQRLESEVNHFARLAAMNSLASTLAHELNQPLTTAANYISGARHLLAEGDLEKLPLVERALAAAESAVMHSGRLIRSLRGMVAKGAPVLQLESVADLIDDACLLALVDAHSRGIEYRVNVDPGVTKIRVDSIQFKQVIINLLRNAMDAVETEPVRRIDIVARLRASTVEISVSDSGKGVDPKNLDRLFEAFNSSKAYGLGIGLAISRTIVEANDGRISYARTLNGGACFTVTVPDGGWSAITCGK